MTQAEPHCPSYYAATRNDYTIEASMLPRLHKVYPQLAHKRVDYAWGGKVGIVVNRVPVLGRASNNVFYSVGYSAHGVNMTHLCGEIMGMLYYRLRDLL